MPHKYNADRHHRIPKTRYKVTNWRNYEAGLRQRGSLTIGQDEATCAVYGMPAAAHALGAVERQLPLPEIGPALLAALGRALA